MAQEQAAGAGGETAGNGSGGIEECAGSVANGAEKWFCSCGIAVFVRGSTLRHMKTSQLKSSAKVEMCARVTVVNFFESLFVL